MADHLMTTYNRLDVTFERGEGSWLRDSRGNKYLDGISGIAVCGLGHAHPAVTSALCRQAGTLVHTSNLYRIRLQEQLADKLAGLTGLDKTFFCSSGAEANESALKLARLHARAKGVTDPKVVVCDGSFHGRTLATLSATGNHKIHDGFEPLVQGFVRVPFNDLDALRAVSEREPDIVAVLIEPVQGEGGVNVPGDDYLAGIRALCDQHDWLMMLDEVQTGMCRTGEWFGFQHSPVIPDVVTLAKALGNGVPIGACLAGGKSGDLFKPGNHASTFGGNPLACSAALAVIETMESEQLHRRASELGDAITDALRSALNGTDGLFDIRNRGLMIGIELDRPCGELVARALEQGVLINVTAGNVIRLLPPLILQDTEAQRLVDVVSNVALEFLSH